MKGPIPRASIPLAFLLGVSLAAAFAGPQARPEETDPPAAGAGPVVLELFTSQGCSSCPPADRLLSRLGRERPGEVIPLSFHVDYWNYIGWTDPFSSSRWSRRQRDYARAFDSGRVYTPQLVIQGGTDCVGSQASCIDAAVARSRSRPPFWRLRLAVTPLSQDRLRVRVAAQPAGREPAAGEGLRLLVALTESGLDTPVGRGENAHRTLHNDHVVRRLEELSLPSDGKLAEVTLALEPGWDHRQMEVVAFVQDPGTMHVVGAVSAQVAQAAPVARNPAP